MSSPWVWPPLSPASGAPSGAAGGDLGGTYPNPNVVALHSGATQLNIGAIADGQMIARSGTDLVGVAGAPGGDASNVYFSAPAVPNALSDEFKSGSSNLATRGFSCVNATTGATMTRVGGVIQAAPGLGANEYRSTLTASGMYIQAGSEMVIYKAASGSFACYADMRLNNPGGPSTAWFFEAPAIFAVAPVVVSNTVRRIFINAYNNGRNVAKMDLNQVYTTIGTSGVMGGTPDGPWGGYVSWNDLGKQFRGIILNPSSERYGYDSGLQAFAAFAPVGVGAVIQTPNQAQCWITFRTFRIYAAGELPGGIV